MHKSFRFIDRSPFTWGGALL